MVAIPRGWPRGEAVSFKASACSNTCMTVSRNAVTTLSQLLLPVIDLVSGLSFSTFSALSTSAKDNVNTKDRIIDLLRKYFNVALRFFPKKYCDLLVLTKKYVLQFFPFITYIYKLFFQLRTKAVIFQSYL